MRAMSIALIMAAVGAALGGCAIHPITYMPDGRVGYAVTCDRFYEDWSSCMVKVGRLCGRRGYAVYYSDEVNRELIAGCRAAPALRP